MDSHQTTMDSTAPKHKQRQHSKTRSHNKSNQNNSISCHNHNNQNSIFILNSANNNILPNNPLLHYTDLNDNDVASSLSSASTTKTASSSVWSSASSTMCSPAAQAIQKLFNCSSSSFKLNHGIESKTFKSKSEILKKKSKFWKYLEGEANDKGDQRGLDEAETSVKKLLPKSFKYTKSKYGSKSYESDNQNQHDLSVLLEHSCSLCNDCRCVDCQIGYFDCENSDDSNSEYSYSEYADDSDNENFAERAMELKAHNCLQATYENCCNRIDNKPQHATQNLEIDSKMPPSSTMATCVCSEPNCTNAQCCQQCFIVSPDH